MDKTNPFQIRTPEKLSPDETVRLFVRKFSEYEKIVAEGHTFIFGPRGIGKSMMFRYLQPDCQCFSVHNNVSAIDFLGLYIPLSNASFTTITELKRLENNASQIINEHIMCAFCLQMIFRALSNQALYKDGNPIWDKQAKEYYSDICNDYLPTSEKNTLEEELSISSMFLKLSQQMEVYYRKAINYTKGLSFKEKTYPYSGPLFDYLGVVLPIVNHLQIIQCFTGKRVLFLIDDADRLTNLQTYILNYWVSTRTSSEISLKISTQYNYKNYYTISGATIDAPHDYSEIDMHRIYTSKVKMTYYERISEIVSKRLKSVGINKTPDEFFPPDVQQEKQIDAIAEEYRILFDAGKGHGNRRSDDSSRYARPDYIRSLFGQSKNGPTYSYAGFSQLVHLSSGITRFFLESAYKMYAEEQSKNKDKDIVEISPQVQNQIVRDDANQFLFTELPKHAKNCPNTVDSSTSYPEEDIKKLSNLINGLGGLFREILLSEKSERRVFSIAISDTISTDVQRILNLGVLLGYFHKSTIGKKDSMSGGRTNLYILNRRLAPIWTLDPTSFTAYLSVKNKLLEDAMRNPDSLLRRLGRNTEDEDQDIMLYEQLSFLPLDDKNLYTIESGEEDV